MKKTIIFFLLFIFPVALSAHIKFGIDVLQESNFSILSGKRVGLVANHASRNYSGRATLEIMKSAENFTLTALFTPEHGYYTSVPAGEAVANDTVIGIPAYSLYGTMKKPGNFINSICDVIVFDVQDIGVRSYTYLSTLFNTIQSCAENNIPLIVLDRANPLGGIIVDGNILDMKWKSFVGIMPISYIHGMTFGEIAEMVNSEGWLNSKDSDNKLHCDLTVVKLEGWQRWMLWEDLNRQWFPTSPHVPTVESLRGLATIGIFGELGMISIGIGTTSPFQYVGSPEFKIDLVNEEIKNIDAGIQFAETVFRPFYGMYSSKFCKGYLLRFPLMHDFRPYTGGIKLMLAVRNVHPKLFDKSIFSDSKINMFKKVTGSDDVFNSLFNKVPDDVVLEAASRGLLDFLTLRRQYLLY